MSQMNPKNKTLSNWIWIRINLYTHYRIVLDVAWHRIYFRCQVFYWWVMKWWLRLTCCPISKYLWSSYRRKCMYQIYQIWNIFSIVWVSAELLIDPIIAESNGMVWSELVWIVSTWIDIELSAAKLSFALSIFENVVAFKVFTFTFRCTIP